MSIEVLPVNFDDVFPFRELYRHEMHCQIIHDSLPRRGFGNLSLPQQCGRVAGYGFVMGYQDEPKDMVREFYVLPSGRGDSRQLFRALVKASQAKRICAQTNDPLLSLMLYDHATEITTEAILFHDAMTTNMHVASAHFRAMTDADKQRSFGHQCEPEGDWVLEFEGAIVATGGFLTHYNPPYGDLYMEVQETYRRRGLGSYLIQELKRVCYEAGRIPAARCNAANAASWATMEKAGMIPCGRLLCGVLNDESP